MLFKTSVFLATAPKEQARFALGAIAPCLWLMAYSWGEAPLFSQSYSKYFYLLHKWDAPVVIDLKITFQQHRDRIRKTVDY